MHTKRAIPDKLPTHRRTVIVLHAQAHENLSTAPLVPISTRPPFSPARHGTSRHPLIAHKKQVILQVVTCSVFLAAIAHSLVLLVCTGWRYTLTWYDPLFPTVFSALGTVLLYMTLANAILVRLRPTGEDLDTAGYWSTVLFALNLPIALAGPLVTVQMVLHNFSSIRVRSENAGTGRELI